ncbi:hypothetical protein HY227_02990 [Candidatus Wolfebacteria bacterium]|nr:hypothetical protein [Candidatus Wolfebacteria bacterium]
MLFQSVLKAVVFGALLIWSRDSWLGFFVFAGAACYFYFRKSFNAKKFSASFLALVLGSFLSVKILPLGESGWLFSAAVFWSAMFFILLGIKNMVFIRRQPIYFFLNSFLFAGAFILFFIEKKSDFFALNYLLLGVAAYALFKEFLVFNFEISGDPARPMVFARKKLISLIFAFLTLQLVWAISILPIGFLNSASLALLMVLIFQDFSLHNWSGILERKIILRNATIFLIMSLIIFAFSRWAL